MLSLQNRALRVDLLDPVADAARQGARFCWGGYIWQVHDAKLGALLSGPEWPKADPLPFNGQGLPESFRHRTMDGKPLTWRGDRGVALGAGELQANSTERGGSVAKPCAWQIAPAPHAVVFTTRHEAAGYAYELTRTIELADRALRSHTKLVNRARDRLALEWFAHPFFPLTEELRRAELPAGSTLAENPGFLLDGRALVQKRKFLRQDDGHMDRVQLPAGERIVATLPHPKLGHVRFETSFAPAPCIIWGNDRTFSIEPYLPLDLAPGETREWSVQYRFGGADL
jgi:hypothetical protein